MPRDTEALHHALSRRGLLGVAAGTTAAALLTAASPAPAAPGDATPGAAASRGRGRPVVPRGRLGIQLYTIRDQIAELGFARVFEQLRRHGYAEVEFAGYTQGTGAITLRELRRLLRDNGLRGIGSHVAYHSDPYSFATQPERVVDDAAALGLPYVGTPWGPGRYGNTVDAWKRAAEEFNTYGAAARARGLRFYQHNHAEEFAFAEDRPDVRLYDVLLAETDPDLVDLELDIYWAYVAQHRFSTRPDGTPAPFDPLDYVLAAPGRFPLFHVKDGEHEEAARDGYVMTDVGDGDLDYRRFVSAVAHRPHGRRHHWLVERDDAPDPAANPAGSLSTARRSAAHLTRLRTC
ncbi:sugar phosphate isomerase/epimerase [Streptomyces sp. TRM 70351]|uniref:sugar phosphate isomerase/epimerase family protein n=1 Tax=Streptomyces sp. TRM 70351 TaxID=3116552 RepID=UPI002E7C3B6C|nr:sugar phosphate isomerase/epimerase [Streptomyces sp. TRM 70351]MEE1926963.1 sugar phosphate isomerase/epimerase [Streptomyces sp. TRM 70351]